MKSYGSAHYWVPKLLALGHTVRLMAPQFVKRYVKTNKNDAADVGAICEAFTRPTMRFVPTKTAPAHFQRILLFNTSTLTCYSAHE
jgi:transposase